MKLFKIGLVFIASIATFLSAGEEELIQKGEEILHHCYSAKNQKKLLKSLRKGLSQAEQKIAESALTEAQKMALFEAVDTLNSGDYLKDFR